ARKANTASGNARPFVRRECTRTNMAPSWRRSTSQDWRGCKAGSKDGGLPPGAYRPNSRAVSGKVAYCAENRQSILGQFSSVKIEKSPQPNRRFPEDPGNSARHFAACPEW